MLGVGVSLGSGNTKMSQFAETDEKPENSFPLFSSIVDLKKLIYGHDIFFTDFVLEWN